MVRVHDVTQATHGHSQMTEIIFSQELRAGRIETRQQTIMLEDKVLHFRLLSSRHKQLVFSFIYLLLQAIDIPTSIRLWLR